MAIILQSVAQGTTSVPVPSGTVNGDCLVLVIADWNAISTPTGWTLIHDNAVNFQGEMAAFYRFASSEPASYTIGSGTHIHGIMARYTGVNTVGTVQASADTYQGNTSPSITTTVANCLVVRCREWANNSGITSSACSGYTQEDITVSSSSVDHLFYNDNSGLPTTTTVPPSVWAGAVMVGVPTSTTTTYPATATSGAQGTATWTPTYSVGNGIATYLSFALTPA